jgi:hypothetical protein
VLYCSKECQGAAWKGRHKGECKQHVEFTLFGNPSESVVQSADEKLIKRREGSEAAAALEDQMITIQRGVEDGDYAALVGKAHIYLEVRIYVSCHMLSSVDLIIMRMIRYLLNKEGRIVHATMRVACGLLSVEVLQA